MDIKTIGAGGVLLVISLAGILLATLFPGIALAQAMGPTTTLSLNGTHGSGGWFTSDVVASLNATDTSGLGINRTEYSFNGSATGWVRYTGPFNITKEDATAIYYRSIDNGSAVESMKVATIDIDKTPPSITYTLTPQPNANGWSGRDVQLHFDVVDEVSGIASRTRDLTMTNEGIYSSLVGIATDIAGNTASVAIPAFSIDKTPPLVGNLTVQGNSYAGDYFPVSASVVEANLARIEWDWGDGTGTMATESNNVVRGMHAYVQPGAYKITLNVVDKAGNFVKSTASVTVYGTVPTAPPTATATPAPVVTPTPTPLPLPSPTAKPAPAAGMLLTGLTLLVSAMLCLRIARKW